ncbi:MAG TPA: DMT family transporter [Candidatus Methylomirabilis sp.]|nr:DMT family transporter [Candidatus Methylomirabilis sp.]
MAGAGTPARFSFPALLLGATAIGLAPIFVRLSELGPIATAFYRMFLSLPLLGIWLWTECHRSRRRPVTSDRRTMHWLVAAGLFFAADLAVWHWSIRITTVANATLLANLAPLFVTLASWAIFGQRFRTGFLVGMAVALAGAFVLMGESLGFGRARLIGDLLGVLTAVFYAGYIISVARLRTSASTARVMFGSAAVSAAALLPLALISGENLLPVSVNGWLVLLALAVVSHAGGQGLIAWALAHLSAAFGSVSLLWQPVAAALFAWILLHESLGAWQVAGGIIVLAGIYLARRASYARRVAQENVA